MCAENSNKESGSRKPGRDDMSGQDRKSMRLTGIGIEFVGVMGVFTYLGYLADKKFETKPWLMFVGIVTAVVGMTYLLYKEAQK